MLLILLYYLALFFEWHCHMSWVTIKISLPVMYIMAKMEYALTLADPLPAKEESMIFWLCSGGV